MNGGDHDSRAEGRGEDPRARDVNAAGVAPPSARSRRSWPRRVLRVTLAIVAVLLVALGILYAFRERLLAPIVIRYAEREVQKLTGFELTIDQLGGDWFRDVTLRGVRFGERRPGQPKHDFLVRDLAVHFSLLELLHGNLSGIESVTAAGVSLRIDVSDESPPRPPPIAPAPNFVWPAKLPKLSLSAVDFTILLPHGREILGEGITLRSTDSAGGLAANAERFRVTGRGIGDRGAGVTAAVRYDSGRIAIEEVAFDGVRRFERSSIDLAGVEHGHFGFDANLLAFGGTTHASGALAGSRWQLDWSAVSLDLDEAWRFVDPSAASPVQAVIDAAGTFDFDGADPESLHIAARGSARGVCFEGREVELPEFDAEYAAGALSIARLWIQQEANRLYAAQLYVPLTEPDLRATLRKSSGWLDVELWDLPDLSAPSPATKPVRVPLHRVRMSGSFFDGAIDLDVGELATRGGELFVRRGRVRLPDSPDAAWLDSELDVDVELDFRDLGAVGALWQRKGWGGSLRGAARISGPLRAPKGRCDLRGRGLSAEDIAIGDVDLAAHADRTSLSVERLYAQGELGRIDASGELDLTTLEFTNLRADVESDAWSRFLPDVVQSGSLRVALEGSGSWRAPQATFAIAAHDIQFAPHVLDGRAIERLDTHGRLEGAHAIFESFDARIVGVDLAGAFDVQHEEWREPYVLDFEHLRAAREELDLALVKPVRVLAGVGLVAFDSLRLDGTAGRLSADLELHGDELRIRAIAEELYAMRLIGPLLPPGIDIEGVRGSLSITRRGDELSADSALSIERLKWKQGGIEAALQASGHLHNDRLELESLDLSAPEQFSLSARGSLPIDFGAPKGIGEGPLTLCGELALADLAHLPWSKLGAPSPWSGSAELIFDLEGTARAVRGGVELTADVQSPPQNAPWGNATLEHFLIRANASIGDEVRVDSAHVEIPGRATMDVTGALSVAGDALAWLEDPPPEWRAIPVGLHARAEAADLSIVPQLVPGVRRSAGRLEFDFDAGGTLGALELSGALRVHEGELRLDADLPALAEIEAELIFKQGVARLTGFTASIGGAPVRARGEIAVAGNVPILDVTLEGDRVLLARAEGMRMRADAALHVAGPLNRVQVTGALKLRDGRYSRDVAFFGRPGKIGAGQQRRVELFSIRQEPWASIEFDVRIESAEPLRVDNNVVRGALRPDLRLMGTGAAPELTGTVFLDPTRVSLPAAIVMFESGTISFAPPDSLVPTLALTGTTRVYGYDITINITGTTAEPEVVLSSVPPLSSEELAVLVLTGQPPRSALSAAGSEEAAQTMAVYLGRDVVSRWFGGGDDDSESWFDRLEWRTGADVSKSGSETTQVSVRLTPDRRKRVVYMNAEKDVYEKINFGIKILFRLGK